MRRLRRARSEREGFPEILFFFPGTPKAGREFFARLWPEARAVADEDLVFSKGIGGGRGRFLQVFGLRAAGSVLWALIRGHGLGKPSGEVRTMPAYRLVRDGRILWEQAVPHAGVLPDLSSIDAAQGRATGSRYS